MSVKMGRGYCDGGYGGGFCTQDAGAEGYVLPVVLGEEGHLLRRPATFGAYGQGCVSFLEIYRERM